MNTDFSVIHDADLEYFPEDLLSMYENIDNKSFVLGSRFIGEKERLNKYRRTIFANRFLSNFFSFVALICRECNLHNSLNHD